MSSVDYEFKHSSKTSKEYSIRSLRKVVWQKVQSKKVFFCVQIVFQSQSLAFLEVDQVASIMILNFWPEAF